MKTEFPYITFSRLPQKGITENWQCENKKSGVVLGRVAWYGPWRNYCFFPAGGGLVFSTGCMGDISTFINQLAADRRGARKGAT